MVRPSRAGIATASAVRISGEARCSVLPQEKARAEAAHPDEIEEGRAATCRRSRRKIEKSTQRGQHREHRDHHDIPAPRTEPTPASRRRVSAPERLAGREADAAARSRHRSCACRLACDGDDEAQLRRADHALDQVGHVVQAARRSCRKARRAARRLPLLSLTAVLKIGLPALRSAMAASAALRAGSVAPAP